METPSTSPAVARGTPFRAPARAVLCVLHAISPPCVAAASAHSHPLFRPAPALARVATATRKTMSGFPLPQLLLPTRISLPRAVAALSRALPARSPPLRLQQLPLEEATPTCLRRAVAGTTHSPRRARGHGPRGARCRRPVVVAATHSRGRGRRCAAAATTHVHRHRHPRNSNSNSSNGRR